MGLFPFVNNSSHFHDILDFFFRFLEITFPVVKEHFWGAIFQGKSYIGEINHLDFDKEKIFTALSFKSSSEPVPFHVSNGFW